MNRVRSRDVATGSCAYPEISLSEVLLHNSRSLSGHVAVELGADSLTFAELGEAVRRAAFGLAQAGCVAGSTVAICMPRSINQIVAILAVHHLGAAYVPINPAHAPLRNQLILDDSNAPILLHAAGGRTPPASAATVPICFETLIDSVREGGRDPWPHDPGAPAYILYTSGSTGEPKGAVLPRGALSNHTLWFNDEFEIGPGDRLLQRTSCTFDASVYEIFCSVTAGATLVLSPVESDEDVLACADAFATLDITRFPCVPSLLDVFLEAGLIARMPRLRTVFLGGEKLTMDLVRRLAAQTSAECVNLYGPTETTIDTTFVRVAGFSDQIPIGKPIANVEVHVVDEYLRKVPDGEEGELLISGAGLGLGYLNRPELTAQSFIPVPPELGGRAYRTGDRGRRGDDGFLYFCGRLDGQIKIRGQRIEMGEIEGVLRSLPGVTAAAVIPKPAGEGQYELHAFVAGPAADSTGDLRSALEQRLTSAMVPLGFHILPSLPLTSSGKIDRQTLTRAVEAYGPQSGAAVAVPAQADLDPLERELASIWSDLLGGREVTGESHFFECGGHSLLAARMILMIRHKFNVIMSTRGLYENPTLRGLAAYIRTIPSAKATDMDSGSLSGTVSFGQQQMWLLETVARKPAVIAVAYELHGPVERSVLEDSLAELVTRHAALRLSFELTKPDYRLTQAVREPTAETLGGILAVRPASWTDAAERKASLEACAHERVDAAGPLLIAATLFTETPLKSVLLITMNHLCGDGWSTNLLLRDLSILYNARLAGEAPVLAPTSSYVGWAELERTFYSSEDGIAAVEGWATRLRGLPTHLELPHPPSGDAPAGLSRPFASFEVDPERKSRLEAVASSFNITPFTIYLAAYEALISEWYDAREFIVTVNFANRMSPESAETVGMYVNPVALPVRPPSSVHVRDLLWHTHAKILDADDNQSVPHDAVVKVVQPARVGRHGPLLQFLLNYGERPAPPRLGPGDVRPVELDILNPGFDILLIMEAAERCVAGRLEVEAPIHASCNVRGLADKYLDILDGLVARAAESLLARSEWEHKLPRASIRFERPERVSEEFRVEIATREEDVNFGLMHRHSLDPNSGMFLLNQNPGPMGIWMRNTFFPLDLVFLDEAMTVVDLIEGAKPLALHLYRSRVAAHATIELPAGTIESARICTGDRVTGLQTLAHSFKREARSGA